MVGSSETRLSGAVASPSRRHALDALLTRTDDVQACYERQLVTNPTLEGRLLVELVCEAGRCFRVRVVEDGLGSDILSLCVTGVLEGLEIPDTHRAGAVTIRMPYVFSPLSGQPDAP